MDVCDLELYYNQVCTPCMYQKGRAYMGTICSLCSYLFHSWITSMVSLVFVFLFLPEANLNFCAVVCP
jgi:hypothetical protein